MDEISGYTDYPILELGDESGKEAPIREAIAIAYDGDKYLKVIVEGITTSFKCGYFYPKPGRCGKVKQVPFSEIEKLPRLEY